jgi:shikimate dehydrogenase
MGVHPVIRGTTRLVGLLRGPLAASLSPPMQNAAFAAAGLDWAYVPLGVEPSDLAEAVRGLVALGFEGANVTIPHKLAVAGLCDELDPVAERAGSVNTLVIRDGRVHGSSTDGLAVTGAVDVTGARVLMLGAGGAAQAVACAVAEAGATAVVVASRTTERADGLAARLRSLYDVPVEVRAAWPPQAEDCDVVIHATPVKDDPLVAFRAGQHAVDMAYLLDGETAFLRAAREAGATTVDGLELLVRQGAASFERWTGIDAPVDVMRDAVRGGPAGPPRA